jgi:para-aminobenzoate synthetase component 1
MPLIQLHAYEQFILDTPGGLQGHGIDQQALDSLIADIQLPRTETAVISWSGDMPMTDYLNGFDIIQKYIRAGDIYQINYTHQLKGKTSATGRQLFHHFMTEKPVSHAAYFDAGKHEIISLSPEGFICIDGQHIVTQPIKGTRPRHSDASRDAKLRDQLVKSKKEQAELYMIVDLLRNDLGKVCKTNTVKVTDPKVVTAMPNVWHTHANIEGQLKDDIPVIEALMSMFPGGSITGCPKHRAMEIIDELETEPRGVYTGSLGYILPDGKAAFNIAIRTLVKSGEHINLGVGGGITIMSEGEDEYAETAAKAAFFRGTSR